MNFLFCCSMTIEGNTTIGSEEQEEEAEGGAGGSPPTEGVDPHSGVAQGHSETPRKVIISLSFASAKIN